MVCKVVSIPCDWGAGVPGGAAGVEGWHYMGLAYYHLAWLEAEHHRIVPATREAVWIAPHRHVFARRLEYWDLFANELTSHLNALWESERRYLFLTGDHSWSTKVISFLRGVTRDLVVVWIDAHSDFHTPGTTPSGHIHGMPLAMLTGLNAERFHPVPEDTWALWAKHAKPCLSSEDLFLVGVRSHEPPEGQILQTYLPEATFTSEAIHARGVRPVIEAIQRRMRPETSLYISFDVDVWDPSFARGTGSAAPGGLSIAATRTLLNELLQWPQTRYVEVTEINPLLDHGHETLTYAYGTVRPYLERED
jgi:arginase